LSAKAAVAFSLGLPSSGECRRVGGDKQMFGQSRGTVEHYAIGEVNLRMNDLTDNACGEPGFMSEKELLAKLPICRRTLGNWKANGFIPYIKIGRRCLYHWASVQGALLRRQRGGA
jgi:hypothetical protein